MALLHSGKKKNEGESISLFFLEGKTALIINATVQRPPYYLLDALFDALICISSVF